MIARCNQLLEDIRGELGEAGKSKADSLKGSIKDVERQIVAQKKAIKDLSDIASPLGPKAVEIYVRKERAHLANRESLLQALKQELKDAQAQGESAMMGEADPESPQDKKLRKEMEKHSKGAGRVLEVEYFEGEGTWRAIFDTEYAGLKVYYAYRKSPNVRLSKAVNPKGWSVTTRK